MKIFNCLKKIFGAILFLAAASAGVRAAEFGSAFTFQGRLSTPGGPAHGPHDFDFSLWDRETGGKLLGVQTKEEWPVSNGVFTVELDFGAEAFALGESRWLEIRVKDTASTNDLVTLAPRTPLRPSPYSLLAAAVVDGSVTAAKLADGAVTAAKLAPSAVTAEKMAPNTVSNATLVDGAVTAAKLADGAVTSPKLASGAVGSQHIAAGAIGASQLAAGSVNSAKIADGSILGVDIAQGVISANHLAAGSVGANQIAAGAVGPAQLASPYQSGVITLNGTFSFAPLVVTQAFSPAFTATPIVTLASEKSVSDPVGLFNAQLSGRTPSAFTVQVTAAPQVSPIERGSEYSPLTSISPVVLSSGLLPARPAFAAVRKLVTYDWDFGMFVEYDQQLEFWRADGTEGANWTSVVLNTNTSYALSAGVVAGRPALAFARQDGPYYRPAFVRASDSSGNSWPAETTVNNATTNAFRLRLAVLNNKPAIVYHDAPAGVDKLWFVGATDGNGTSWGPPRQLPALPQAEFGDFQLLSLNGYPGVFFYDSAHDVLMFTRAADTNGVSWGSAMIVAANVRITYVSAMIINGRPAVAYHSYGESRVVYQEGNDANGTSFGVPVNLAYAQPFSGTTVALTAINNRPGVLFSYGGLFYTEARDATGTAWSHPMAIGPARESQLGGLIHIGGGIATVRLDYPGGEKTGGTVDYVWSGPGPERLHWMAIQP